jgi:TatD DNase family protein
MHDSAPTRRLSTGEVKNGVIDTHSHLTDQAYRDHLEEVLSRAKEAGVEICITVGTDVADSRAAIELTGRHKNLYCTAGVHPHAAGKATSDDFDALRTLITAHRVCAVGEVGLDYHYDFSPRKIQQRVLADQLALAGEAGQPVVFHCREAFDDSLAVLDEWGLGNGRVVFHCFSGGRAQARAVLDRDYRVSFTGTITFANAAELREVVRYVPLDRIMLETDCPYLSPEPMRKIKPNEPALLVHIADKLAELKALSRDEITRVTTETSRAFFQLDRFSKTQ